MHWKTEMLSCIKCHGISAIYSDSRLKEMIKREHCLKQVLQSSSNLRTHWILSPARHLDILKTCIHFGPCWASWVWLVYSWAMNTSSQLKRCLENFKERHFLLPSQHLYIYSPHSTLSPTRHEMGSHSSVPWPPHPWHGERLPRFVGPKRNEKNFSRLSAFCIWLSNSKRT